MPDPITPEVAALVTNELQRSNASNAEFDEAIKAQREQFASLYNSLAVPKTPALPPEVQEIVSALQVQPRLIPAVQKFVRDKVAAINAAVASVLGEVPPS